MPLTKIDICNHALLKVGADAIASLDTSQSSDEGAVRGATLCNILYDQALDELLRIYPWNCCTKSDVPTRLSEAPAYKYDYAFQLPNDCLRVINVFDSPDGDDDGIEWVVEGKKILCNSPTLYLKYVFRPTDISDLDSLAAEAFICKLAMKLCVPLQLDDNWATRLNAELYEVILPSARSIDTIENKELLLEESSWVLSRNHSTPFI